MAGFIYGDVFVETLHHALEPNEMVKEKARIWADLLQQAKRPIYWKFPEADGIKVTWSPMKPEEIEVATNELRWFLEVINEQLETPLTLASNGMVQEAITVAKPTAFTIQPLNPYNLRQLS